VNAARTRAFAALVAVAIAFIAAVPARAAAPAGNVSIPLSELGYRDGVTVAGVAPSVTFDLPRYASLQAAALHLELHVSPEADLQSTIAVAVNGKPAFAKTLRETGHDARLVIPLPVPASDAELFAITVSGAFTVTGGPCANDSSRKLFLRIGRDSAIVLRTASGGSAEAFFRDYRGSVSVSGSDTDVQLAAVPYRIDRLEPWHRIDATLVAAPPKTGRALVLAENAVTSRSGDVLNIAPQALAALPDPLGQTPVRHIDTVAFGDLHQHLGSATGTGDLAFDVPLAGSVTGGVPQRLAVHAAVTHSALPAGVSGTLQVLVNGVLTGARDLGRGAETQTIDVAVPPSLVGPSNNVRVLVATDIPATACAGAASAITASLLDTSSFSWSGVRRRPPSVESFITALNGNVAVLIAPGFTPAAFHVLGEIGKLNAAIVRLDVQPWSGSVPDGYDYALIFAPPDRLAGLQLPLRPDAPAFTLVNPTDNRDVLSAAADTPVALVQLGQANQTPILAFTYHGDGATALAALERVNAGQLTRQVADVTVVSGNGVTVYDVGEKLRPSYAGDLTPDMIWSRVKLGVALLLLVLMALGMRHASRRLTGKTI
jgi:hypothetical protein